MCPDASQEPEAATWELHPTEDGIRVGESILWLDSQFSPGLSFLSSASGLKSRTSSKFIATEETSRLLAINNIRLNALIVPYNHQVSIGPLKLELLPAGSGLGTASLYAEGKKGSLLYAPKLQPQKSGISRTMQLKPAETLVLGAFSPFPASHHPSRKKEKERLLSAMQKALGSGLSPVLVCEPYAIAQEIIRFLSSENLPIAVSGSIFRANKLYESYGSDLGPYLMQNKRTEGPKIIVVPRPIEDKRNVYPIPPGPLFMIDESALAASFSDIRRTPEDRFVISEAADARELKSIIQTVEPREVFITGPYAKQYATELRTPKIAIEALFPRHLPTLF